MIGLDLDDTLLIERTYLANSFRRVSENVLIQRPDMDFQQIYSEVYLCFETRGRTGLYDFIAEKYALQKPSAFVSRCIESGQEDSCFEDLQWNEPLLDSLVKNGLLARAVVITNGRHAVQSKKIQKLMEHIRLDIRYIICDSIRKPDPRCASEFVNELEMYIGDSFVDKKFAENLGIPYLHPLEYIALESTKLK
jgi:hypothetical protein